LADSQEAVVKLRAVRNYNSHVVPTEFKEGDLVLKKAQPNQILNKLFLKWVKPYSITQVIGRGTYKLSTLIGYIFPSTWNASILQFYYS